MRISLGLALLAAAARADAPRTDEAVAQCLATPDGACDASAPCPESSEYTRACLESRVPWRTAYARVHCCLRCCLRHWLRAYGLDANWRAFAEHGASQGANELLYSKPHRLDEMLVGFNHQGLLPFAARRLTMQQAMWTKSVAPERRTPEMRWRCVGERCGAAANDATDALVWGAERTAPVLGASRGAGGAAFGEFGGGWAEIHFGDGCSSFREQDPFGTFRKLPLQAFGRSVLPALAATAPGGRVALVTSSDCALPDRDDIPQARARARARALDPHPLTARPPTPSSPRARAAVPRLRRARAAREPAPRGVVHDQPGRRDGGDRARAAARDPDRRARPLRVGAGRARLDARDPRRARGGRARRRARPARAAHVLLHVDVPAARPRVRAPRARAARRVPLDEARHEALPRQPHRYARAARAALARAAHGLPRAGARARARANPSFRLARARSLCLSFSRSLSLSLDTYRAARATRRRRARRSSRACTGTP